MASRWLQQKAMKQKRMRRAYLKKFSTKSTGIDKEFGFFNEKGEFIDNNFRSRNRAAGNFIDYALLKKYKFKPDSPEMLYALGRGIHGDLMREIQLARTVQSKSGAGTLQGEERLVHHLINDDSFEQLRFYMGREICFFVGHRIIDGKNILYGSIQYTDRKQALRLHREGKVTWIDREEVPIPPSTS